jgi:hypothetical protein
MTWQSAALLEVICSSNSAAAWTLVRLSRMIKIKQINQVSRLAQDGWRIILHGQKVK